jgi:hypothetical protein
MFACVVVVYICMPTDKVCMAQPITQGWGQRKRFLWCLGGD